MATVNLGAHMSIAGGVANAIEEGLAVGCQSIQLFTRNSNQWEAKPLSGDECRLFRTEWKSSGLRHAVAHDCYLINIASPKAVLRKKSLRALKIEMDRAEALGLDYLVMHPGAHVESCAEEGLKRIAEGLDRILWRCRKYRVQLLLENTAGQGSVLGSRFEELAKLIELLGKNQPIGICFDTCHAFAAGYDFRTPEGYRAVFEEFDRTVGVERIRAFHLNDSKKGLGNHVDRHEHIGEGQLGLEAFRLLVNDQRFRDLPMILETPKEGDMDRKNLALLRSLVR